MVETTNFNGKWSRRGGGSNLNLVERFTVTDSGTLDYEYTVHDPESFVGPWTVAFPFTSAASDTDPVRCH